MSALGVGSPLAAVLSHWATPLAGAAAYVVGVHLTSPGATAPPQNDLADTPAPAQVSGGKKARKPFTVWTAVILLHNVALCVFSGIVCVKSYSLLKAHWTAPGVSAVDVYCDPQGLLWSAGYDDLTYWFYASKFYELIDTMIIIVKGRSPIFLQTYRECPRRCCCCCCRRVLVAARGR